MIGYAGQNGQNVYVYGPTGIYLWNRPGELQSFTSQTVLIKQGSTLFICGERGQILSTKTII